MRSAPLAARVWDVPRPERFPATRAFVVAAFVAAGLTGCATATDDTRAGEGTPAETAAALAAGVVLDAQLDATTGAITFPTDAFLPSEADSRVLDLAAQLQAARCAAAEQVHYLVPSRELPPEYAQDVLDGPWTTAQAERFGFVRPMTDADLRANEIAGAPVAPTVPQERPGPTLADIPLEGAENDVVEECMTRDDVKVFDAAQRARGAWTAEIASLSERVRTTPEAFALRDELRECYESRGLAPDEAAFESGDLGLTAGVAGADAATIDPTQIALALEVVACKDDVQYTQRAAALLARAQASVVVAHLDEMRASRSRLDEALVDARDVIAANAHLTTAW